MQVSNCFQTPGGLDWWLCQCAFKIVLMGIILWVDYFPHNNNNTHNNLPIRFQIPLPFLQVKSTEVEMGVQSPYGVAATPGS